MNIDQHAFTAWVESHFDDIQVSGDEIKVNDPFWQNEDGMPDKDKKCWINIEKGCYNAFKSERHGSIFGFIMAIEGCSYEDALSIAGGDQSLYAMEKQLLAFLEGEQKKELPAVVKRREVELPPGCFRLTGEYTPAQSQLGKWAQDYLLSRQINPWWCGACSEGRYRNRIIIPYYDRDDKLIYFNSRALDQKEKIRYLGPKKEDFGVGKGDVLWMSSWPKDSEKIYLTEGEFDAMSLAQCGLNGGACGSKEMSSHQVKMLSPYRIALAFDADKAGGAVFELSKELLAEGKWLMNGVPRITLIRPPAQYKDWNKFYQTHGKDVVLAYIDKYEKVCTQDTLTSVGFDKL